MKVQVTNTEISFTVANTVYDSSYVRVYAAANSVVTVANTGGTIGTFTIPGGRVEFVEKQREDTIAGTTTLNCAPIAFK